MADLVFEGVYSVPLSTAVPLNFLTLIPPSIIDGHFVTDDVAVVGAALVSLGAGTSGSFATADVSIVGVMTSVIPPTMLGAFTTDDATVSGSLWFYIPILRQPLQGHTLLVEITYTVNGVSHIDYFSNSGYTTRSDDITPNQHYLDSIFDDPYIVSGFEEPLAIGNLKLRNNGELDAYMTTRSADGQTINIYSGYSYYKRADFTPIFTGIIKSMRFANDEVHIVITDNKDLLNGDVQKSLYPDTTGVLNSAGVPIDNAFSNDGKPIPLLFGECFNVTPNQIDVNQYEYHQGSVPPDAVAMRDNGAVFLSAITPDPAAIGKFTVLSEPIGAFTGNLKGYIFAPYSAKLTDVFKDIAKTVYAGALFDATSFSTFEARNNPRVGVYLTDKTNAVQLLDDLMACVRGTWFFNAVGDIELAQIDPVSETFGGGIIGSNVANIIVESYSILSIGMETHDGYPACYKIKMGANKNWTPQPASSMASGLPATTKKKYKDDYESWQMINHVSVQAKYRNALFKTIDTSYLVNAAEVKSELAKRAILHERPRYLMKVKCTSYWSSSSGNAVKLGDTVQVKSERYSIKSGILLKFTHHFISGIHELEVLV